LAGQNQIDFQTTELCITHTCFDHAKQCLNLGGELKENAKEFCQEQRSDKGKSYKNESVTIQRLLPDIRGEDRGKRGYSNVRGMFVIER
jgi:hypothetical protein